MSIYDNHIVIHEIERLESLIGTDDGRDVVYDINILKTSLNKIEDRLLKDKDEFTVIDANMWEECHTSLFKILDEFDLIIDDNLSQYDYYEFVIKHEDNKIVASTENLAKVTYIFGVMEESLNANFDLEDILEICEKIAVKWENMIGVRGFEEEGYITAYSKRVLLELYGKPSVR